MSERRTMAGDVMGVNCCDVCPSGLLIWCSESLHGTPEDVLEHWRVVDELGIYWLFPCAYGYQHDWCNYVSAWKADMMRYYHRNQEA